MTGVESRYFLRINGHPPPNQHYMGQIRAYPICAMLRGRNRQTTRWSEIRARSLRVAVVLCVVIIVIIFAVAVAFVFLFVFFLFWHLSQEKIGSYRMIRRV